MWPVIFCFLSEAVSGPLKILDNFNGAYRLKERDWPIIVA
jgi:hypothetical protein